MTNVFVFSMKLIKELFNVSVLPDNTIHIYKLG